MDMMGTCWRERRRYEVAAVDVYSGSAFVWAEAVCRLLRVLGKPYSLTLHGGNLPTFACARSKRVSNLLASAAVVTAPSRYLQEQMRPYRENIRLVPNGIDIGRYPFQLRRGAPARIMWLRAFHDTYHPELAIQVLARLASEFPDVRLTMIGPDKRDGSRERTEAEAQRLGIADRLTITGSVPKAEVSEKLGAADIFLNTSRTDNTPVSVIEAMARGLCVVSTNVGGIPYLLQDEHNALLVPAGDDSTMAAAVRRILTRPDLAEKLSSNARRDAEQFDWSCVLPRWNSLLRPIAQPGQLIPPPGHTEEQSNSREFQAADRTVKS